MKKIRLITGIIFVLLFAVLTILMKCGKIVNTDTYELIASIGVIGAVICFFPYNKFSSKPTLSGERRKISKRTLASILAVLVAVPVTMYIGIHYLGDRKYYFISLLIIIEILIPFLISYENKKPQARELVIISVLCAMAVAGRMVFFMLPQFKPVLAIVIISGIMFGGETGFLVGAVTAFVSNFYFGQGPWTVWQMVSFGAVGFLAGVLFSRGLIRKNRITLCIFGFLATVIVYGFIVNTGSVLMMQQTLTLEAVLASEAMGLSFDLIHGASVAFFLWFIAEPMMDKLERIKAKYGLLE